MHIMHYCSANSQPPYPSRNKDMEISCESAGRNLSANWRGGGAYSYIRVLPDEFLLKSTVMTTDLHEYPHPPPSINALVTVLNTRH